MIYAYRSGNGVFVRDDPWPENNKGLGKPELLGAWQGELADGPPKVLKQMADLYFGGRGGSTGKKITAKDRRVPPCEENSANEKIPGTA